MVTASDYRDVVSTPQGKQIRMILRFEHDYGDAHCLARLVLREPPLPPVAVFSEVRTNPSDRGLIGNLGRVADALVAAVADSEQVPWDKVIWVGHYGEFSGWHIEGAPEGFFVTKLIRFNGHFHEDVADHSRSRPREFEETFGDLGLDPVPDTLRALGLEYHDTW